MTNQKYLKILLSFFLTLACSCSKTNFTSTAESINKPLDSASPGNQTCGINQISVNRPAKVLFVVDQSGSNADGPNESPGIATDPEKKYRLGVMQKFYSDNLSKSNINWGLTVFNNSSAKNLMVNSAGNTIPFSSNSSDFGNAINSFIQRPDQGATPYKSALQLVRNIIATDLLTAPEHVLYLVIFLTDGYPTDYCSKTDLFTSLCNGTEQTQQILHDIVDITNLAPNVVQFSTAYYGLPDSVASNRLEQMAKIGSGQFVDTNKSYGVQLNDLIKVDQQTCVNK